MPHTGTHAMDGTMRDAMLTTEYTELYYVDQSSPTAERALNGNSKVHPRHHGLASDSDVSVCPRYGADCVPPSSVPAGPVRNSSTFSIFFGNRPVYGR